MQNLAPLIAVFERTRAMLAAPGNDFIWSFWEDGAEALAEIDGILAVLRAGSLPGDLAMRVLFAPTGPIQEVSLSSGWGDLFIELADSFDSALIAALREDDPPPQLPDSCHCLSVPPVNLTTTAWLGLDRDLAEVSVELCGDCGRHWLRYFHEVESFTGSGRWYLGVIALAQLADLTADRARDILAELDLYYYGGSYYRGENGRMSGPITPGF
jgi:hypothetical protein